MRFALSFIFMVMFSAIEGAALATPFEDGQAAYHRGEYAVALQLLRPLADQGYAKAMNVLGVLYQQGQGVTQDYTERTVKAYRGITQRLSNGFAGVRIRA
jgi:uncharacterized protein